jgi:hypothetical protein
VADVARRMMRNARAGADPRATERENSWMAHIAGGRFEALAWLVDLTDVSPATGAISTDRSPAGVAVQAQTAQQIRAELDQESAQAMYLLGVVEGLAFASGFRERFWWVPLSEEFRLLSGPRDEYGRTV